MKTFIKNILVILLFILGIFILNKCTKEKEGDLINDTSKITLKEKNTFNDLFIFPIGTALWINGDKLEFELPDGFEIIFQVVDLDGNISLKRVGSGSVTCECTDGYGCSPYIIGDQSGCSTDGTCSTCIMTTSSSFDDGKVSYEVIDAQILNFSQDIQFLLDEKDYQKLEAPKSFIFNDEKVLSYLEKFLSMYNNLDDGLAQKELSLKSKSELYIHVPTNFLGLQILSTLNKEKCSLTSALIESHLKASDGGTYSCECGSGSSGCTYGKKWTPNGTIHYCEAADCTRCTLSGGSSSSK